MTTDERARLRALAAAATSGPWTFDDFTTNVYHNDTDWLAECHWDGDGQFIAAAREAVPALLDEVDRLEAELKQYQGYAAFMRSCALSGEPPETFEWYMLKQEEL